ncbi:MAG: PrgI family protein [Lachnospiraceae bacterium]|nr:PrgI family protein [Lachnospiraceae bacterium]
MAISAKAPKNFSKISNKTKVALNLTKRQLICFGAAAFVGVPLYIGTRGFLGNDISAILMMIVMVPLFILAMYERDGKPAEKILGMIIRQRYILPGIRRYRSENLFEKMEEKDRIRREVAELEAKAQRRKGGSGKRKAGSSKEKKNRG